MIQLNYKPTYEFSSIDLFDYADSDPMIFTSLSRQQMGWAARVREWVLAGANDVNKAAELVGMSILSVKQGDQVYSIGSTDNALALRDAIEASAPGYGDKWLCDLLYGHWNFHFSRSELGN